MFKSLFASSIFAATLIVSAAASAQSTIAETLVASQLPHIQGSVVAQGLDWKVGQECNYKLNIGGFLNGTMKMYVREIVADGIWMVQDIDMTIQKQKVEILIDPANGQIKKMLVDGKEQAPPKADYELIEQREDKITVPAGTFEAIYLKIKDKANNDQISEQWVNPRDIPLSGMLQSKGDSQMGKVVVQLTSFKK